MAIIRGFWYRGTLSPYEILCLRSFIEHGHSFILYSYENITVPPGITVADATEIFPEDQVFFYNYGSARGSPSAFSNLFRYELLRRFGGWWCDLDVICLQDQLPEQDMAFAYEDALRINGAILKIPANHPFACELVTETRAFGKDVLWGQAGPHLITRLVKENKLEQYALPTKSFYPIHWSNPLDLLDPDLGEEIENETNTSIFLHIWNEMLRRAPVLKQISPPEKSYFYNQFKKYGIEFDSGLIYTEYQFSRIKDNTTGYKDSLVELKKAYAERDAVRAERDAAITECRALRANLDEMETSTDVKAGSVPLYSRLSSYVSSRMKPNI